MAKRNISVESNRTHCLLSARRKKESRALLSYVRKGQGQKARKARSFHVDSDWTKTIAPSFNEGDRGRTDKVL